MWTSQEHVLWFDKKLNSAWKSGHYSHIYGQYGEPTAGEEYVLVLVAQLSANSNVIGAAECFKCLITWQFTSLSHCLLYELMCNVHFTVPDKCLVSEMLLLLNITMHIYEVITDVFRCVAAEAAVGGHLFVPGLFIQ